MSLVDYSIQEGIGTITLNRADKRNALNGEVVRNLTEKFKSAEQSDDVKVLILKARGEAFCAGADLAYLQELQKNSHQENLEDSHQLKQLFSTIYHLKKVVIAEVQGHAIAGGCGLVTVCDFCFSVPHALFGYTEVRIGFIPALVMAFLIRKIGDQRARSLLLSGDLIEAGEARELGIVNRVVEQGKLEPFTQDFARRLIKLNSKDSMAMTKEMIADVQDRSLEDALIYAAEMNARARSGRDCVKGINAFLNKKPPHWD